MKVTLVPSCYYHIYVHANSEEKIFHDDANYYYFLARYRQYINSIAETLAYCLMPDHFHLLIKIRDAQSLDAAFPVASANISGNISLAHWQTILISRQFSRLFNSYVKSFNNRYQRNGSLFIKNFKRMAIHTEQHLIAMILYIHFNPIHHGLVKQLYEWPWSSWSDLILNDTTQFNRKEVMNLFGSKKNFLSAHQPDLNNFIPTHIYLDSILQTRF